MDNIQNQRLGIAITLLKTISIDQITPNKIDDALYLANLLITKNQNFDK